MHNLEKSNFVPKIYFSNAPHKKWKLVFCISRNFRNASRQALNQDNVGLQLRLLGWNFHPWSTKVDETSTYTDG